MREPIVQFLNSWKVFVVAALCWCVWAAITFWPVSRWLEVPSVRVADTQLPQPVLMIVDRRIRSEFRGQWTVEIRRQLSGAWVLACTASGAAWYRPSSALPDPLTLDWWTDRQCAVKDAGVYRVDTTWRITDARFPDRYLSVESNTFRVAGAAP